MSNDEAGRSGSTVPETIDLAGETALDLFTATVERLPNHTAVHYHGSDLSYRLIDEHSDRLASHLEMQGFAPGDRLACSLQNEPQFVVATVAAWKAGGTIVPVNPMWKQTELRHLLLDCTASAILTSSALWADQWSEAAATAGIRIVVITSPKDFDADDHLVTVSDHAVTYREITDTPCRPAPLDRPTPDSIAFLTYTSGTTGLPKGAMNTQRNVAWNARALAGAAQLTEDDICLGIAPLFHVTGLVAQISVSFALGMTLVLADRFDPRVAAELVEETRATYAIAAITAFRSLLDGLSEQPRDLSSLRKVYSGGAPMMPSVLGEFERVVGAYIHNIYGMTETTSPTHMVPIGLRAPVDPQTGAVSVGKVLPGTVAIVVDESGAPCTAGELGEIVVSGPQVIPGYWHNERATAETIQADGLHTGDIGYVDDHGWFYVVDRKKDMINASGFKVWPREVEDALCEHPEVREAAVIGVPDDYRGESVAAFVVTAPGSELSSDELIEFARARLAAYKYPRQLTIVDELPKTATGKVMRRELRKA